MSESDSPFQTLPVRRVSMQLFVCPYLYLLSKTYFHLVGSKGNSGIMDEIVGIAGAGHTKDRDIMNSLMMDAVVDPRRSLIGRGK